MTAVFEATGRQVVSDRYHHFARTGTVEECRALGLLDGTAVLAGTNDWMDQNSYTLEHGESVTAPNYQVEIGLP
jgi:hypothetical protein